MLTQHKLIVTQFIEEVWNQNHLDRLGHYLHPDFTDHSLPAHLPADSNGLRLWIAGTSKSFEHHTRIESLIAEDNEVMIRIKMSLTHIGEWRGIAATGAKAEAIGYRHFRMADGKIAGHWGLVDGNAIEQQLQGKAQGCKIQA